MCSLVFYAGAIFGNTIEQQRQNFLLAERMIEQGNESGFVLFGSSLADYPLYPYLQYQWLKNNLSRTDKILAYLSIYNNTRYAGLLRSKWLDYLADNERWAEFLQFYQTGDNGALECRFYWAHYKAGDQKLALNEAKRLWLVGETQPIECDSLFSAFMQSPGFTRDLIWERFELALAKDNTALAGYLQHLLDKTDQSYADVWLQVHKRPELIEANNLSSGNERHGRIFAHGVERLAKSDLDLAIKIWDSKKGNFAINIETVQKIERKLALELAHARDDRAYQRLNQLDTVDAEVRDWKFRAALLEQNWQHVAHALAALTIEEQAEPKWQYWQARSLVETGYVQQGQIIYNRLSADRSFYGFMAADVVNKPYSYADKPVSLAENALESLAQETDFKVVRELAILDREVEAKRQWWFTVKKLPREQLLIAAKLAQQWQWDQVAIITLVKADYWDDLELRFPLNYLAQVQNYADWQNLDPAIIFGLIRQESMLDKNARSAAGALGLMQIMPETGRQIARSLKESGYAENALFNPEVNIKYGSFYFKQLLNKFNGHFALATAAYNAGPHRATKWLPNKRSLPADIWIETIPFNETRKYVTAVLSYAIIYQQRMKRDALKITKLLFDVRPY